MHRTTRKRAPARAVHRRVNVDEGDELTAPTAPRSRASVKISTSSESCVALPSQDTSAIHGVVAEGQRKFHHCSRRRRYNYSLVPFPASSEKCTRAPCRQNRRIYSLNNIRIERTLLIPLLPDPTSWYDTDCESMLKQRGKVSRTAIKATTSTRTLQTTAHRVLRRQ